jgi:hypothetical protein
MLITDTSSKPDSFDISKMISPSISPIIGHSHVNSPNLSTNYDIVATDSLKNFSAIDYNPTNDHLMDNERQLLRRTPKDNELLRRKDASESNTASDTNINKSGEDVDMFAADYEEAPPAASVSTKPQAADLPDQGFDMFADIDATDTALEEDDMFASTDKTASPVENAVSYSCS